MTLQVLHAYDDLATAVSRYGVITDNKRTLYHLTLYRWPFLKKRAEIRRKKMATRQASKVEHAATVAAPE